MLVLLIVFMVITPMLQNKVNVELAKVTDPTSMPDADKKTRWWWPSPGTTRYS